MAELQLQLQAYLQIFAAILKKKGTSVEQQRSQLAQIRRFLQEKVQSPSDFISHLPTIARSLSIPESTLASFVGSHFVQALAQVRQAAQAAEAEAVAKTATTNSSTPLGNSSNGSASRRAANLPLLEELLATIGETIPSAGRFVPLEFGLLKLVHPGGEVLPRSQSGGAPAAADSASLSGGGRVTGAIGAPSGTPAKSDSKSARQQILSAPEESLLELLVAQFRSEDHHSPPKLEPSDGIPGATTAAAATPGSSSAHSGATSNESKESTAATTEVALTMRAPIERPIFDDIFEKFGESVGSTLRIVPSDGLGDQPDSPSGYATPSPPEPTFGSEVDDTTPPVHLAEPLSKPIPFPFEKFHEVVVALRRFQSSSDRVGYQKWMQSEAGSRGRLVVALRSLERRLHQGEPVDLEREYSELAKKLKIETPQIVELAERFRRYDRLSKEALQLGSAIRQLPGAVVGHARRIWPQLLALIGQEGGADSLRSGIQIVLLQIPDAAAREAIASCLETRLEKISGGS